MCRQSPQGPRIETIELSVVCEYPVNAFASLKNVSDIGLSRIATEFVIREAIAVEAAKPVTGAEPNEAVRVTHKIADRTASQPLTACGAVRSAILCVTRTASRVQNQMKPCESRIR